MSRHVAQENALGAGKRFAGSHLSDGSRRGLVIHVQRPAKLRIGPGWADEIALAIAADPYLKEIVKRLGDARVRKGTPKAGVKISMPSGYPMPSEQVSLDHLCI